MMQVPAFPMPQPLHQPEVSISNIANAICVRWINYVPSAASYIVEVFDYASSASNRFSCPSPGDGSTCLELCIQGLQAGQSYAACVRSLAQDGSESPPSPWSRVVVLPVMGQAFDPSSFNNTPTPHMPSPTEHQKQQPPSSPHSILNSAANSPQKSHEMEKMENLSTVLEAVSTVLEGVSGVLEKAGVPVSSVAMPCPPPEITGNEDIGIFLD